MFEYKITGTTDYSTTHFNNILSDCRTEMARNIYATDNETLAEQQLVIVQTLSQICPHDCSGHGTCINGKIGFYIKKAK